MSVLNEKQRIAQLLSCIGKSDSYEVKANVARNPFVPKKLLRQYAEYSRVRIATESLDDLVKRSKNIDPIKISVAENPATPEETRRSLASDGDSEIIEALLRNPSMSEPEVEDLMRQHNRFISQDKIANAILRYYRPITPNIAEKALQIASFEIKDKIARILTSPVILDALEKDSDKRVPTQIMFNHLAEEDRLRRIYDLGHYNRDNLISWNLSAPPDMLDTMLRQTDDDNKAKYCMDNPSTSIATLEYLSKRPDNTWDEYVRCRGASIQRMAKRELEERKADLLRLTELVQQPDESSQLEVTKSPVMTPRKLGELANLSDKLRKAAGEAIKKNVQIHGEMPDAFVESRSTSIMCKELKLPYIGELLEQPINFRDNLTEESHEFANQLAISLLQKAKILQKIEECPEIGDMIKLSDSDFEILVQNAQKIRRIRIIQIVESISGIGELPSVESELDEITSTLKKQIPTISGEIDEILRKIEVAEEIKRDIRLEELDEIIDKLVNRLKVIETQRMFEAKAIHDELAGFQQPETSEPMPRQLVEVIQ